jgi:hypothetical protein
MKMQDVDMKALDKDLQRLTQPSKQRGWFRRNWKWVVPLDILLLLVIGAAVLYWVFYTRIYNLDVCQKAMVAIESTPAVAEALGEHVQPVLWPSREAIPYARIEENDIVVDWHIEGPKGRAKAHLVSKNMRGKWETTALDVTLPDGKTKIPIQSAGDPENEAKRWTPGTNPPAADPGANHPETKKADLDINIPDMPTPGDDAPPGAK